MSTEKRVRVRVKLYDDNTDIYSQDIDMSTGEGVFIVPTVMADAPYVNLQVSARKSNTCSTQLHTIHRSFHKSLFWGFFYAMSPLKLTRKERNYNDLFFYFTS